MCVKGMKKAINNFEQNRYFDVKLSNTRREEQKCSSVQLINNCTALRVAYEGLK